MSLPAHPLQSLPAPPPVYPSATLCRSVGPKKKPCARFLMLFDPFYTLTCVVVSCHTLDKASAFRLIHSWNSRREIMFFDMYKYSRIASSPVPNQGEEEKNRCASEPFFAPIWTGHLFYVPGILIGLEIAEWEGCLGNN